MEKLIATLRQAHKDTCSLHCPSVWKTEQGRPPHSERCQAVEAAIEQVERQPNVDLISSLKLWMVGWRDDLSPDARAQMEEMNRYYDKTQGG